ncbi:MFS transporter [Paenibacillus thalictri]|uniref:MFS transporter n=1 Tax=Paenibacillus thalictri TaxID=2527873 RepID=A0A4Q9DFU5_9BACL|nr:MFS transporter [Paenibacillus thalictri]TBL69069.1 MFS transporter [Paenibacillus thalictri]
MERLWTKAFILISIGMFFLFSGFYSLYPTLPLFIKQMGGTEAQVGLAAGAFMLSAVIFRPIVGVLLDRFGRRPFIVFGLLFFTLTMYMYTWIGGIIVLIVLRILHGMGWAVSTTAVQTAISDIIPSARRGEGLGWFGIATTMAMAVGPMFGIWVSQNYSYHTLFLSAVGLSAAALFLTFGAKMPFQAQSGTRKVKFFEKSVFPVTVSAFFHAIAYGGITTFVPLFANGINVNPGSFFMAYAATLLLIRPFAGKLVDRHGEMVVIIPAFVITILALINLSFSTGLFGVLVSAILYGIGYGSAHPTLQSATIRLADPDRKGGANASLLTAVDLGIGLGAMMLGWVSLFTSYQVLFTISAVSVTFSMLLYIFLVKRLSNNNRKGEVSRVNV